MLVQWFKTKTTLQLKPFKIVKMKISLFVIAVLLFTITACNQQPTTPAAQAQPVQETPEVLGQKSSVDIGKQYSRYDYDIITKLYEEAIEKNEKLEELDEKIKAIFEKPEDELEQWKEYLEVSNSYFRSASSHVNLIQDSTLRESSKALFMDFEAQFEASIKAHLDHVESMEKRKLNLQDQLVLLKLFVTKPMIMRFQENEKPNLEQFKQVIKEYDGLIDETKAFITEIKS